MKADAFRKLACDYPDAVEGSHMGHADFRVRKKIFASLSTDEKTAVVALSPDQQASFMADHPDVFTPSAGAWGAKGWTQILLAKVSAALARRALELAWRSKAPKALAAVRDA